MKLPIHIAWSGQGEYDLDDPRGRAHVYELVMTEGNEDDVRTYIDLDVLLTMWDTMWLAPHVREQWAAHLRSRGLISSGVLTALQERICRLVGSLPGAESAALAGGGALIVLGIVEHRYRQDFPVSDEHYERLRAWVHSWRAELPASETEPPYRESQ